MDGDEPIVGDDMTKEKLPAEMPVHVITEPAIGQPTLEEEAAPVEEETPMTEEEKRKALYNMLAGNISLVQEVVGGYTTFSEALDEIVYELGHPQEESECMEQFGEYITTMALLTAETPVDAKGLNDIITYHVGNTKGLKGLIYKITLGGGVVFGGSLGAGFVLERWYPELALLLKASGASGLTSTGLFRGYFGMKQLLSKNRANKQFAPLYERALTLDAEVQSLYFKEG